MDIENINSLITPVLNGVIPARYPLSCNDFLSIPGDDFTISISMKVRKGSFVILSNAGYRQQDTDYFRLRFYQEESTIRLVIEQDYFSEVETIEWELPVTDVFNFSIVYSAGNYTLYDNTGFVSTKSLPHQKAATINNLVYYYSLVTSFIQSIRVYSIYMSPTQYEDNKASIYNVQRSLSDDLSDYLVYDFNLSTLDKYGWYSIVKGVETKLNPRGYFAIKVTSTVDIEHGTFTGVNPFLATHKLSQSETITYQNNLIGALTSALNLRDDPQVNLPGTYMADGLTCFTSNSDVTIENDWTVQLIFQPTENEVLCIGNVDENPIQYYDDNWGDTWRNLVITKQSTALTIYDNETVLTRQVEEDLVITGLIRISEGINAFKLLRVFNRPFTSQEVRQLQGINLNLPYTFFPSLQICYDGRGLTPYIWRSSTGQQDLVIEGQANIVYIPQVTGFELSNNIYPF